jgi:hypothetical protein
VSTCPCGGDRAGYARHRKAGEMPCADSLAANREYSRRRRAETKKKSAPVEPVALTAPAAPDIPETGIKYLSLAEEGGAYWSTSVGFVDPATGAQTVIDNGSLGLPVGERLIELVVELVDHHRPTVLLISEGDARRLGRFDPWLAKRVPDCKVAVIDPPTSWVFETDGSRAQHLARTNVGWITRADRVQHDRAELEREQLEPVDPRRNPDAYRYGVMKRGKLIDVGKFEVPETVYEPIPANHPALRSQNWTGVILPERKGGRGWTGGR